MAFVLDAYQVKGAGFVANISGDLSGTEAAVAAVADKSIYITSLIVSTVDGETVTLGAGETGGAVTNEALGPYDTGGGTFGHTFVQPMKITEAVALVVDSSGAGPNTVTVEGFIE